jgi:dipeptidyl aminopeptidase/acylaminoacyl peptidase
MIINICCIVIITCCGLSAFVGWLLTHPAKRAVADSPANYELNFEEIQFKSRGESLQLKGWFLPSSQADKTVIFAHGYRMNRSQDTLPALALAKSFIDEGYQVVLFDFRNSGNSEGKVTSVGEYEKNDLLGAIDWVKANHPSQTSLLGFSMGGTAALLAAAEEPFVQAVISDSPFSDLKSYLSDNLPTWSHLWKYPFTPLIMNILPILTGLHPEKVNAFAAVDHIYPRPILFIHSTDDRDIPYTNSERMWQKHPDRFEFWKTSKAGHVASYNLEPVQYTARVLEFLRKVN